MGPCPLPGDRQSCREFPEKAGPAGPGQLSAVSICPAPGVGPEGSGSGCPTEARSWGSPSGIRDAEQLLHEGRGEGVDVVDAQQPLGVLGVDAAELREPGHDLQEQEPAGRPEGRLGCSPPWPHLPPLDPSEAAQVWGF